MFGLDMGVPRAATSCNARIIAGPVLFKHLRGSVGAGEEDCDRTGKAIQSNPHLFGQPSGFGFRGLGGLEQAARQLAEIHTPA